MKEICNKNHKNNRNYAISTTNNKENWLEPVVGQSSQSELQTEEVHLISRLTIVHNDERGWMNFDFPQTMVPAFFSHTRTK